MQEAFHKLDYCPINIAEQTVIDALENCNVNRNMVFSKAVLRRALSGALVSVVNASSRIRECFKNSIYQVETAPKLSAITASAVAKDTAAMALIAR